MRGRIISFALVLVIVLSLATVFSVQSSAVVLDPATSSDTELVRSMDLNAVAHAGLKDPVQSTVSLPDGVAEIRSGNTSKAVLAPPVTGTGIDVSHHQGTIDWNQVKSHIDFAILRCGYGVDRTSQDDQQFQRNVSACESLGIPYGVYLYSYAETDESVNGEINHALRLLNGHHPTLPVYLDLEEKAIAALGKTTILKHARAFCNAMADAGFRPGVYANYYWWTTYLTSSEYDQWSRWIARYGPSDPGYSGAYDFWQYTEEGSVPGISGKVDMNYAYCSLGATPAAPTITSYSSDVSSVTLNWSKVSNATSYRVDFRKAGDEYATVKTGLTATSYTISGLEAGTKYYARVYAVNSAGTSPKQDGYAVWTKCESPVITSALAKGARTIVLTWGAVSGADSYTIAARWDDQEYVYLAEGVTGTSYTFSSLNPNTRYYFRVYAINEGGRSGRSETVSAQTLDGSLASATVTLPAGSYTYTGSAIQPKPTVKQNNITLTEGTDYTLSYTNNVNAGTATVTVTGKGNYSNSQSVNFTIQPKALTDSSIHSGMDDDEDGQWRYLGYPLTCALFDGNVRLKEGTDYTATYTDNLNAGGTATATFVGKGNYTGTKVSTVRMVPRDINIETSFALSFDSANYTGSEIKPKATVIFDHNQDGVDLITLQEGTDYTLEYRNNVNPGTATVVVRGIGNFSGSKELTFQIVKSEASPFSDVPAGKFYTDAVFWAVSQNPQITNGYADGTFRPDQTCTRAQVVTFLWRANGCPEPKLAVNPFKDVSASAYYYKAVLWALENGITTGYSDGTFRPNDECTRAHVVTFLWRSEGSPEPESMANPFTDVPAGSYYAKAVLWALENGITTGKTPTTFNPDGACTRAHVVTFLYRDRAE